LARRGRQGSNRTCSVSRCTTGPERRIPRWEHAQPAPKLTSGGHRGSAGGCPVIGFRRRRVQAPMLDDFRMPAVLTLCKKRLCRQRCEMRCVDSASACICWQRPVPPATGREWHARPQQQAPVPCAAKTRSSKQPRWPRLRPAPARMVIHKGVDHSNRSIRRKIIMAQPSPLSAPYAAN
jgi:hypothetical protein